MKPSEKLELVKATIHDLGVNFDKITVAEAYDVFLVIEKKITWSQFMTACRTLAEQ